MEFPSLGQHCQEPTCKQTDYLPFKCECGGIYCREHFTSHCLSTGCGLPDAASTGTPRQSAQVYRCSSSGCGRGSLHEILCPKCGKHFCIEHRFHPECPEIDEETLATQREAFAAPRRQFNESNDPIQKQITENIRKALLSTPKIRTASKIQLMRIKQKAIGPKTIHVFDRAFFSIIKPKDFTAKVVNVIDKVELVPESILLNFDLNKISPVFVSKKWSLGRTIDTICELCNIANDSNKLNANKVKLFRASDGYCVGNGRTDMDIEQLINKELLLDGDTLIVEYMANDLKHESGHLFLKLPVESVN